MERRARHPDERLSRSRHRFTAGFAFDNNDDLIEEYSGFRLAVREPHASAPRGSAPGLSSPASTNTWEDATLAALAVRIRPSRKRTGRESTFEPTGDVCVQSQRAIKRRRQPYRAGVAGRSRRKHKRRTRGSPASARTIAGIKGRDVHQTAEGSYQLRAAVRGTRQRSRLQAPPVAGALSATTTIRSHCRSARSRSATSAVRRRYSSASHSVTPRRFAAGTSSTSLPPAVSGCFIRRSSSDTPTSPCSSTVDRCGTGTPSRGFAIRLGSVSMATTDS